MIDIFYRLVPLIISSLIAATISWLIFDKWLQLNKFPNGRFWDFICECIRKSNEHEDIK